MRENYFIFNDSADDDHYDVDDGTAELKVTYLDWNGTVAYTAAFAFAFYGYNG